MPKFPVDVATERCRTPQFVSPGEHDGSSDSPGAYLLVGGEARRTVPPINKIADTRKATAGRRYSLIYLPAFFLYFLVFLMELFCNYITLRTVFILLCVRNV